TPLDTFPIGEAQFETALNSLVSFIEPFIEKSQELNIRCVGGNHSYYGDYAIYKCIQIYFKDCKNVNVEICINRWLLFKVGNSLFIAEHGYSPFYKSKVPNFGKTRDSYVQSLFLENPQLLVETKHRYFLVGDLHTLEHTESNHYDYLRVPSIQRGSKYA